MYNAHMQTTMAEYRNKNKQKTQEREKKLNENLLHLEKNSACQQTSHDSKNKNQKKFNETFSLHTHKSIQCT